MESEQVFPEKGRKIYLQKCGEYSNKDEDKSPKTLNDKNHQAQFQKFRKVVV